MHIALSPCPNDTFLFHAWIAGFVGEHRKVQPHFADIEELNHAALEKRFPLIKLSFPCLFKLERDYQLLDVGAALGHGVGPKIIAKNKCALDQLSNACLALPGSETTAHYLVSRLLSPPKEKIFCPYHEIGKCLREGRADMGVIIHESRFTFAGEGFYEVADLGELWYERTHLPLPLGALAVRKDHLDEAQELTDILRASLAFAQKHPHLSESFVKEHAQEKKIQVIKEHIALYVSEETMCLSAIGKQAIETLRNL